MQKLLDIKKIWKKCTRIIVPKCVYVCKTITKEHTKLLPNYEKSTNIHN